MALLDRFRAQSGHKHPDAAVRLTFVQEVPLDERELLTEIAPAIKRAIERVKKGEPALIDVVTQPR